MPENSAGECPPTRPLNPRSDSRKLLAHLAEPTVPIITGRALPANSSRGVASASDGAHCADGARKRECSEMHRRRSSGRPRRWDRIHLEGSSFFLRPRLSFPQDRIDQFSAGASSPGYSNAPSQCLSAFPPALVPFVSPVRGLYLFYEKKIDRWAGLLGPRTSAAAASKMEAKCTGRSTCSERGGRSIRFQRVKSIIVSPVGDLISASAGRASAAHY